MYNRLDPGSGNAEYKRYKTKYACDNLYDFMYVGERSIAYILYVFNTKHQLFVCDMAKGVILDEVQFTQGIKLISVAPDGHRITVLGMNSQPEQTCYRGILFEGASIGHRDTEKTDQVFVDTIESDYPITTVEINTYFYDSGISYSQVPIVVNASEETPTETTTSNDDFKIIVKDHHQSDISFWDETVYYSVPENSETSEDINITCAVDNSTEVK
mmetsp:Transcript_15339/g.17801  ORF Transcript_15339/g.17801 Transcript_15339/m.17801 type:complete len:215 (-) Transcript_15339:747-1391(-)